MKKQEIIRQIRNITHLILGYIILYFLINRSDFIEYAFWMKIVGALFGGFTIGGIIGAIWEFGNKLAFGIEPDTKDVFRTSIGAVIGFFTATLVKDLFPQWILYFGLGFVIFDLIRAKIAKSKKK